ncbi:hypothetical protein ACTIVE_1980 [Actinomadura verrucosospora]|uniref:Uncharacterized protein n=1 Tax=Actinomadura verrucosospora TaxID=46165 RepID=A0A7D3ZK83_ACTVE|nr:hypothetical protein ACTIVE_1980 [Actinomadura verrucosospora]
MHREWPTCSDTGMRLRPRLVRRRHVDLLRVAAARCPA